ncbi:MAG: hypothetical protein K2N06_03570 [Oscillospiraceae bacterium]|nr:hypothetical protein [Oscillospiraceae bacterium]
MTTYDSFIGLMIGIVLIFGSILCSLLYLSDRLERILYRQSRTECKVDSFKELYKDNQVNLDYFFNESEGTDNEKRL